MPITITQPTTGQPFGPGFMVQWQTDRIGPEPPGTTWHIIVEAPIDEVYWAHLTIPYVSAINTRIFLFGNESQTSVSPITQDTTDGSDARLRIQLVAPDTSGLEQTTTDVVLDRQQGQAYELYSALVTNPTVAAPTLTEEEHNAVLQTNVGVIAMSGINPLQLVGDLLTAIRGSEPLAFGSLSSPPYTLTGDGDLPDPEPLLPKWGVYWVATVIPAGLSHRHGQSEEYPSRLVQWRTVHEVGGVEMVTELLDAETHGELWRFRQQSPRRVEYSILPGVTLQAQWWQFP